MQYSTKRGERKNGVEREMHSSRDGGGGAGMLHRIRAQCAMSVLKDKIKVRRLLLQRCSGPPSTILVRSTPTPLWFGRSLVRSLRGLGGRRSRIG